MYGSLTVTHDKDSAKICFTHAVNQSACHPIPFHRGDDISASSTP